jgi:small subunit ribosomal protein S20
MAQTVSSKKRIRQNETHNLRNKARKSAAKTQMKKVLDTVKGGDATKAEKELSEAYKLLDKCGEHNTYHPNKTGRMKSALARKVKSLK